MAIAKYAYTALDCENPIALAEFYSKITGWAVEPLGDFPPEDVTWLESSPSVQCKQSFNQLSITKFSLTRKAIHSA
jgi:hypothetical protein